MYEVAKYDSKTWLIYEVDADADADALPRHIGSVFKRGKTAFESSTPVFYPEAGRQLVETHESLDAAIKGFLRRLEAHECEVSCEDCPVHPWT